MLYKDKHIDKFKTAVILAGGKSSRMGFDKQFLKLKGKNLIDILIQNLKEEFEEIIIVTNKPNLYDNISYKIISDEIKGKGPLSGIYMGLKVASSEYVYFTACDMPNINIEYIRYMKNKLIETSADACVTKIKDSIEPFNSFYCKRIFNKVENFLLEDKRALKLLIKDINTLFIEEKRARHFSPQWEMFLNLNTEADLNKYLKMIE